MPEELPTEEKPESISDKEGDIKYKFKVGQLVQLKGFKIPYLVVNRFTLKNFPHYDVANFDKTVDWRTYFNLREDLLEGREPISLKRIFNKILM